MNIKNKIARFYYAFLIKIRRIRLKNTNFTILANNCCGGIMYHDLGEKFLSPTINLAIDTEDFLLFVENLEECLKKEIVLIKDYGGTPSYPIGKIEIGDKVITINFMHYKSFAEAVEKWNERKKRIQMDNLFVFVEMGIFTTDELVDRFENLPYKNKIAITNKEYPYLDTCFVNIYNDYHWGKLIEYIPKSVHSKRYLDNFNYIEWLNNERK